MLHTWQKSYNLRRNEENLAAKLLKISGEVLTAKLKDLGANLIIDLSFIRIGKGDTSFREADERT